MAPTHTTPPALPRYRPDLDGLRALCVLLVVLFHSGLETFSGGFIGVGVFFVLSGFLISAQLLQELRSTGDVAVLRFYARRARRILPLQALVLVTTAAVAFWLWPPDIHRDLSAQIASVALLCSNWVFASQAAEDGLLLHFWSLSLEEQFYLLWPWFLWAVFRSGSSDAPSQRRRLAFALGALIAASFTASVVLTPTDRWFPFFGLHTRAWQLASGAAVAAFSSRPWPARPWVSAAMGWLGVLVVLAGAVLFDERTPYPGTAALVPVTGAALLVLSGETAHPSSAARLLSLAPVRYLGRLSYAWYLWHWPCVVVALRLFPDAGSGRTGLAFAVSLGLAAFTHHTVEEPLRRRAGVLSHVRPSLALGGALVFASLAAAAALYWLGGDAAQGAT